MDIKAEELKLKRQKDILYKINLIEDLLGDKWEFQLTAITDGYDQFNVDLIPNEKLKGTIRNLLIEQKDILEQKYKEKANTSKIPKYFMDKLIKHGCPGDFKFKPKTIYCASRQCEKCWNESLEEEGYCYG